MPAFRAVLDTNVVLASKRTTNPTSPNREVLDRWERGEYTLLHSDEVLLEYGEKLCEHGFPDEEVRAYLELVQALGEPVSIEFFHLARYPSDSDDIAFVLCALNGAATHLVTYDEHLFAVAHEYPFVTCRAVQFLTALRAP